MYFLDVVFLYSRDSSNSTFSTIVVNVNAMGVPYVLEL